MFILLGFAFLSGLVTILAPCIWPLLPIVLSSSIAGGGGHRRPLGITLGIMLSFTIFTLTISYLVSLFHLDPNILRMFAVVVIGFLGLTMIIQKLNQLFESGVTRLSSRFGQTGNKGSGFTGGFITGISLGIVWSPCAGPILAAIATLAATGQVSLQVFFVTVAYVTGVGIPLFAFAYGGQRFLTSSRSISRYTGRIQQIFGVVMLLTALLIYTNYDKAIQVSLLDTFPQFGQTLTNFESNPVVSDQLAKLKKQQPLTTPLQSGVFNDNRPAPEITGITTWLNIPSGSKDPSKSLTLASLRGKVVLIDFWTYTCINCIRTLPHVTSWYDKYKDQGFVVIGVHTPEFAFEKDTNNVLKAISQYNIHYPVAQDNDYATWTAFQNQYWPAEYLIDSKGIIRRTHFGEGKYDETEQAIQALLKESGQDVTSSLSSMPDETPSGTISPETYLGSDRMLYYADRGNVGNGQQTFVLPQSLSLNSFAFSGDWTVTDGYAESGKNAALVYYFTGAKVFLVMRPSTQAQTSTIKVLLDGKPITDDVAGHDVKKGLVTLDSDKLYELVRLKKSGPHFLRLEFQTPGTQAFAFTFGD